MKTHRCDQCGKRRRDVTVYEGRDLCSTCLPPLPSRSKLRDMKGIAPGHRDPLFPAR